ncbi:MAG: hypothetical protein KBE41_00240 [Lutibacter sp.]|nr:hypothetical protein [Lutibacter sp.]MBP9599902.1 hypothetical protein [Lutibacter sp.]
MKKTVIILAILFIGCAKKELKIPTLAEKGIQEIQNHSQVWFFYEVKNNDTIANINKQNTISTTHWIYNIDKNLPLKTIVHSITELKYKHANSLHSEEGMHNYFSYSDTISKRLSFLEFDNTTYVTDSILSKYDIKKNSETYKNYNNLNLVFNNAGSFLNDTFVKQIELKATLKEFIEFSSEGKQTMLHLNFDENTTYQNYLFYKTLAKSLSNETILVNNNEYIFNVEKVPDCRYNKSDKM